MGYEYYDSKGFLDLGPSITGWRELKEFRDSVKGDYPALDAFIENGQSRQLKAIAAECQQLAGLTRNKNIKISLNHLAGLCAIAKVKVVLVL